jgi:hypothetical protein
MAYPGAVDTNIGEIPSLIKKYAEKKKQELAEGKRKELLIELERGRRYLEGTGVSMIPDMHGNIMYLRSKMNTLEELLGPIKVTYDHTPTVLNKEQILQVQQRIFYLYGHASTLRDVDEFKARLMKTNTDPENLESPRLTKIIIFIGEKDGQKIVRLHDSEINGAAQQYIVEKKNDQLVMTGTPALSDADQRTLFVKLAEEIRMYGSYKE